MTFLNSASDIYLSLKDESCQQEMCACMREIQVKFTRIWENYIKLLCICIYVYTHVLCLTCMTFRYQFHYRDSVQKLILQVIFPLKLARLY